MSDTQNKKEEKNNRSKFMKIKLDRFEKIKTKTKWSKGRKDFIIIENMIGEIKKIQIVECFCLNRNLREIKFNKIEASLLQLQNTNQHYILTRSLTQGYLRMRAQVVTVYYVNIYLDILEHNVLIIINQLTFKIHNMFNKNIKVVSILIFLFFVASTAQQLIFFYHSRLHTPIFCNNYSICEMSIYSGFATRHQQEHYDQSISSFLYILQKRIIKFFKSEPANDIKFIDLLTKIYHNLKHMQESKYLEPKLTNSVSQLMEFLKQKRVQLGGTTDAQKQKMSGVENTLQQRKKPDNKVFTNSKTSLQAINLKRQKINVTQRVAFKTADKQSSSQLRNAIIKKRKTTNVNYRSSIGNTISDYQNVSEEQNYLSEKSKYRLDDQLSQLRSKEIHDIESKKQSKGQISSIKKQQRVNSQQEVRELIKGYLVKKKKVKDVEKSKIQIQQIFKVD